jgi:hypothetical protein
MINAYVYKIINKSTNEYYFGYRSRNQTLGVEPSSDLWVKYFTSSNKVKRQIKEHGVENFETFILFENIDPLECWKYEQQFIKDCWSDPLLLNSKYHDPESNVEKYRRVGVVTEECRMKMSLAGKGRAKSEEHRKKIGSANTGKRRSEETCKKISKARMGRTSNKGVSPPKFECPHCGKHASRGNLNKWHNDRCKVINPETYHEVAKQITNLRKRV